MRPALSRRRYFASLGSGMKDLRYASDKERAQRKKTEIRRFVPSKARLHRFKRRPPDMKRRRKRERPQLKRVKQQGFTDYNVKAASWTRESPMSGLFLKVIFDIEESSSSFLACLLSRV